ncbi:MAG: metal-dependent hydrolase [Alphaproteobacteria bacterium CG_4_10_14_0_8_um_filter_53_9]|nr:MAG: metal-dependent hydrolase [Alphaproteobacteria bacterium CG_4_10_14_0_8_um_filter_53_9]
MELKYLGHSAFALTTPTARCLIDPFLTGNSTSPWTLEDAVAFAPTHILLTHGHDDHIGDTLPIAKATGATVVAFFELANFLKSEGAPNVDMGNYGGTLHLAEDVSLTFVPAWHTSKPGTGAPAGLIIQTQKEVIYHAGDTAIFGDMALIEELYHPTIGLLPVGDRFTMDGPTAALACKKYFNFKHIVPMHYATFPIIDATADRFVSAAKGLPVQVLKPGENLDI